MLEPSEALVIARAIRSRADIDKDVRAALRYALVLVTEDADHDAAREELVARLIILSTPLDIPF